MIAIDAEDLTRRWVAAFGEPPALIDAELMRSVLEHYGAAPGEDGER